MNYYLEQYEQVPKPKLRYLIKHNKALKSISISFPSRNNANTKNVVTISEDLGNRVCTCKTYMLNGECYHVREGISLLEAAFELMIDNECEVPNE